MKKIQVRACLRASLRACSFIQRSLPPLLCIFSSSPPLPSPQKKAQHGNMNVDEDDPFDLFIAASNIRFCYYKETHKILGSTYGMCILQDFEAITPNLLGLLPSLAQACPGSPSNVRLA